MATASKNSPASGPPHTTTSSTQPTITIAPDQALLLVRGIWCLSVLALLLLAALPWADLRWTLPPTIYTALRLIVAGGGLIMIAELSAAAFRLMHGSQQLVAAPYRFLRIRTPNPEISASTLGANPPNGADLWYALHRLLPEQQTGAGAWVATTLSAKPDEPVAFGVVVGGGTPEQIDSWASALRQLIIGHNAEAVVDTPPDPLADAIERALGNQGATLAWAEFLLPHSPAYPLRVPDDAESDLLGPLAAQIRPRVGAVRYAEVQIVTQPRHDWRVDSFGWRSAAHRRLAGMKRASGNGILSADGKALDTKLDNPAAATVLRVVLVAASSAHARQMLREVDAVLGQYANRSGHVLQRWTRATSGMVDLSEPRSTTTPTWQSHIRSSVLAGVASVVLGLASAHWPVSVVPWIDLPTPVLPILMLVFVSLWVLLPFLVLLAHQRVQHGARIAHWQARLCARPPRLIPPQPWLLMLPAWRSPAILSADELGGLWHLPSPNLGTLAHWLPSRHLPAPPHAFIGMPTLETPTGMTSRRITLGHAIRSDGKLGAVGPSLYDIRNILHVTAGMGGGKSRMFANIAKQLLAVGFVLIDGKGDDAGNLTATVRQYIPRDDERRIVLLDITDTDWPVSLNPLAGIALATPGAIDRVTAQIQSIFARLDPEGWTSAPGMQQFLDMGTRLVVETVPLPTVAHVKQALIDETYRKKLLAVCTKLEVKTFWEVIYPTSSDQQKTSMNALMRRFDKLLLSDLVRSLMSQERPTFRFDEAIAQHLIILCPIPHVTYGPLAATAAMLMFQSFLRAAFDRPGTAATRSDYPLIIDEFQVLVEKGASEDVAVALTQLRSLGIPTMYAHQALAQIGELRDVMMINAESRVLIRTQEPDAGMYAKHYSAAGLSGADITNQEPSEHQYVRFLVGGKPVGPISMVPLPWPTPLTILPDPYDGPDWQTIRPSSYPPALPGPVDQTAARMATDYDQTLLQLIYHTPISDARAMLMATHLTGEQWYLMNSRWEAIARTQRQYILDHPGCIPGRDERVRWLSRLGYARPRLLAEIEFLRIRQATGFNDLAAHAAAPKSGKGGRGAAEGQRSADQREHWTTNKNAAPPIAPADSSGTAPQSPG